MKEKLGLSKIRFVLIGIGFCLLWSATDICAQIRRSGETSNPATVPVSGDDYTWWYITLFVLAAGLAGAIFWVVKSKKAEKIKAGEEQKARQKGNNGWDAGSLDADKEMEWLRKNQNLVHKKRKKGATKRSFANDAQDSAAQAGGADGAAGKPENDGKLPVFTFEAVEAAKTFSPLPLSNDEALLSAIEQAHDEYEEDEAVRELSVRILTAFKTRNSIEALSQVALYDLSSSLRSKAITTLTEFDHESVFETILLACADPTREVRAAAARGLTRLSLDRADAWARIIESGEDGRICQAARAAAESGFVERSFDRLVHPDRHNAYEAFVLLSLLVRAGETAPIFNALKNHKDKNVQSAILHLLKVSQNDGALSELYNLLEDKKISPELRAEIDKALEEFGVATV